MAPRSDEEVDEIIKQLTIRERQLSRENNSLEKAAERAEQLEKLLSFAKLILGGVIVSTLFLFKLWLDTGANGKAIERIDPQITKLWTLYDAGYFGPPMTQPQPQPPQKHP